MGERLTCSIYEGTNDQIDIDKSIQIIQRLGLKTGLP